MPSPFCHGGAVAAVVVVVVVAGTDVVVVIFDGGGVGADLAHVYALLLLSDASAARAVADLHTSRRIAASRVALVEARVGGGER